MHRVSIASVVSKVDSWNPAKSGDGPEFDYIDLSAVDRESKVITGATRTAPADAPSRARQLVRSGDVLVSTVRPNLNGVAAVPSKYDGATASTGFTVLRPQANKLDGRFLYHWVRTPSFVRDMTKKATGASYPAVSDAIVKDSGIPLPALEEQRRIAAILDKADAIRRKRRAAIALTEELLQSTFVHTVGDRHPNYDQWSPSPIADLAAKRKGAIRSGPFGSALKHSEFVEEGVAVLGIDNAVQNRFAWGERRFITHQKYEKLRRYKVFPGDVIITIMGTTGRSAVVPNDIPEAITTKHLATITVDRSRALPEYLSHALHRDDRLLFQVAMRNRGAIMAGLNLGIIKELVVRLPPLAQQRAWAEQLTALEHARQQLERAASQADTLFHSLVQRAFRGDL